MTELFNIGESLSPKAQWIKDHSLSVGMRNGKWEVWGHDKNKRLIGAQDETEEDALVLWAQKTNTPTWHKV